MQPTAGSSSRCASRAARLLAVCVLSAAPLAAQWSVGVELGQLACRGGSTDTSSSDLPNTLRPSPGATFALRVQRRFAGFGAGIALLYSQTGVGAENDETTVEIRNKMELLELAPEVFVVLARPGAGGVFLLHAGVLIDRWSLESDERNRMAGLAAVSLDWPMAGRLSGTFRAGLAVGPSVFNEGEMPEGFERRATWRRSITAGILVRL